VTGSLDNSIIGNWNWAIAVHPRSTSSIQNSKSKIQNSIQGAIRLLSVSSTAMPRWICKFVPFKSKKSSPIPPFDTLRFLLFKNDLSMPIKRQRYGGGGGLFRGAILAPHLPPPQDAPVTACGWKPQPLCEYARGADSPWHGHDASFVTAARCAGDGLRLEATATL
jgi:hypothetical protein